MIELMSKGSLRGKRKRAGFGNTSTLAGPSVVESLIKERGKIEESELSLHFLWGDLP